MIQVLYWNKYREQYVMRDHEGNFVEYFHDCVNFRRKYPGLNKHSILIYRDLPADKLKEIPKETSDEKIKEEIKESRLESNDNHGDSRERKSNSES